MKWEEESYSRKDANGNLVSLEEYAAATKPTGWNRVMSRGDAKLYAICGVGFMLDAYDLFIINLVTPIWTYEYWGGLAGAHHQKSPLYPFLLRGAVNAAANIGNVVGQLMFGFLGDAFGRKFVYGKELIIAIVGIILTISLPNYLEPTRNKFWYLFGFRVLMGIGIGGDYPMSGAIVAERTTVHNRGRMLAWIFSNQGWGTLAASIITLILLGCFKAPLERGEFGHLDAIWRIQIGVAIVPALITLYFRLTMPESKKFLQSSELSTVAANKKNLDSTSTFESSDDVEMDEKLSVGDQNDVSPPLGDPNRSASIVEIHAREPSQSVKYRAFMTYFSEWRHLKVLIGTAGTWFLVDIAFYGINLNQSVILSAIGFSKAGNEYETLLKGAYGNLIVAAAGYVPGYFVTVALIETLGRRWIQIQGFLVTALMFGIIAGDYTHLSTGGKFACFTIAQFFFNFGPNATTFILAAECYPSRVRGLAMGVSAAIGKLGAILSGVLFNYLASYKIGVANTIWIFFACNLAGAALSLLIPETMGKDADAIDYEECQEAVRQRDAARHNS